VDPYRALMEIWDAFPAIGAAANIGVGVAMLLRSHGRPDEIVWRRKPLPAPRLAASIYLSLGVSFSFVTVAHVFFQPGGFGYGILLLAALVSIGVFVFVGLKWIRRRDLSASEGR
jgi:hypothetical protein